jgi:hypothetical protein
MRTKTAVWAMILVGIWGCAHTGGIEEKEKIYGKNPPVIEQSFASDQLRPGDQWKIYVKASDLDGDMEKIIAVVNQTGFGSYPVSMGKIKGETGKELSGYVYLNTSTQFGYNFLNNLELTVSLQVRDKAGHTSQAVIHSVLLLSRYTQKSPPAGVFQERDLGPIMVVLRSDRSPSR